MKVLTLLFASWQVLVDVYCEYGYDSLCSINGGEFIV
jgi:hypothetical protein